MVTWNMIWVIAGDNAILHGAWRDDYQSPGRYGVPGPPAAGWGMCQHIQLVIAAAIGTNDRDTDRNMLPGTP